MKYIASLFLAVAFSASAFAQLTSPSPPPGVGVMPAITPAVTPTETTLSAVAQWHHYKINLAQAKAIGTGASGDVTLATLPANALVSTILIKPSAALAGPSATTGTITISTVTGTLMSAYTVIGITPGATVFSTTTAPTAANAFLPAGGVLKATIASDATGGLAALTAFGVDVWVEWVALS